MVERVDVENLVVGAGVVGLAIGAALARRGRNVFVLERGAKAGAGISSRNSEVIHSGLYYPTDSLKHRLCVEGRRSLYAYCDSHGVAYRKCGKFVVAVDAAEGEELAALARRAVQNGVENVELLDGATAQRSEPELRALCALHVKETGIVDSHGLMVSLVGEIEDAGGGVLLNHRLICGRPVSGDRYELEAETPSGRLVITTEALVVAAGPWTNALCAKIEGLASSAPPLFLTKGSYFALSGRSAFTRLIYPLPIPGGLGVHLTLALDGRVKFGPDVEWLSSNDPDAVDFRVNPARGESFYASVRRYWPALPDRSLVPDYAGVRPKLSGPGAPAVDFCLQGPREHGLPRAVAAYGLESPGLTSSLAIGAHVVDLLES